MYARLKIMFNFFRVLPGARGVFPLINPNNIGFRVKGSGLRA